MNEATGRKKRIESWPSIILSIVALVLAMGGGAYAARALPENSVGRAQLKDHAVGQQTLRKSAVGSAQLRSRSVGKRHLRSDSVGTSQLRDGSVTAQKLAFPLGGSSVNSDRVETLTTTGMCPIHGKCSPPLNSIVAADMVSLHDPALIQTSGTISLAASGHPDHPSGDSVVSFTIEIDGTKMREAEVRLRAGDRTVVPISGFAQVPAGDISIRLLGREVRGQNFVDVEATGVVMNTVSLPTGSL